MAFPCHLPGTFGPWRNELELILENKAEYLRLIVILIQGGQGDLQPVADFELLVQSEAKGMVLRLFDPELSRHFCQKL